MSYKNIRIPKRGGGTRLQRVQVLKSGKYKFVKNPKKKTTSKKKRKSTSKGGNKLTKRYKMTIPIAPIAGLLAGLLDPILSIVQGNPAKALDHLAVRYAGYSTERRRLELTGLQFGLVPLVIGLLVHKFVGSYLGVNRMLGRARVPLLRL